MSFHFLLALVEAHSEGICSAGRPSAPLKSKHTGVRRSFSDSVTGCYPCSLSGMTCERLTDSLGGALWMSLQQVSPASHSALPEKDSPKTIHETAGLTPSESFAKYDPDGACWRTSQVSLLTPTLEPYSETWPRQGSMRNGMLFQRPTLAPRIFGKGFGSWPTPTVIDATMGASTKKGQKGRHSTQLSHLANDGRIHAGRNLWPTVTNQDAKNDGGPSQWNRNIDPLNVAVKRQWRTPLSSDGEKQGHGNLGHQVKWPTPTANCGTGPGERGGADQTSKPLWPTPLKRESYLKTKRGANSPGGTPLAVKAVEHGMSEIPPKKRGQLNPAWVEWLMGWPIGWTDLRPLEMDKFRLWQQSLSRFLADI